MAGLREHIEGRYPVDIINLAKRFQVPRQRGGIACGANAISKRVFSVENRIERSPNVKFIGEYISRLDEMIERKKTLFA